MIERSVIFDYAKRKFKTEPDYPFEEYPDYAVLRHSASGKWFALLMNVSNDKLGRKDVGHVDILDVKCHPMKVHNLKSKPGFRPAYHMNKEQWLTVLLDGSVPKENVFALLDESYKATE